MGDPFQLHFSYEKHLVAVPECQPFQVDIINVAGRLGRQLDRLREILEGGDERRQVFQANLRRGDIEFQRSLVEQFGGILDLLHAYLGTADLQVCLR